MVVKFNGMKKIFLLLVFITCSCLYANAENFLGDFCYNEDGKTSIQIHLSNDGSYWMKDFSEGTEYNGTYEIEGKLMPGAQLDIEFTVDGEVHKGKIVWGTQDKPTILFSGLMFVAGRPKR